MRYRLSSISFIALCSTTLILSSCATTSDVDTDNSYGYTYEAPVSYSSRLSPTIANNEKVIVVDPSVHAWGAYENGQLIRSGLATAGSGWCPDIGRSCRTSVGQFTIKSLGAADCKSSLYPIPDGGAPMPYCMFFNGSQGLHGSGEVVEGNVSHGCVRLNIADAEWIRYNFASVGTKVIVRPY